MRFSLKERLANIKAAEAAATKTQPAAKATKRQRPIIAELQAVPQQEDSSALQTVEQATLLPLDAPVVDPSQPCRSYKVAQKASDNWVVSEDGGKTNDDTGMKVIGGHPVDLTLEITPTTRPSGNYTHDYRLRLAFFDHDGVLSEINLNAVTIRDGVPSASTTARTLIAALAVISQSEDDMIAFIEPSSLPLRQRHHGRLHHSVGSQWQHLDTDQRQGSVQVHTTGSCCVPAADQLDQEPLPPGQPVQPHAGPQRRQPAARPAGSG